MIAGLSFDDATHTYRFEGRVVPGVTGVLAPLSNFDRVPPAVLAAASSFGSAVHLACELDDLGQLDEATLDPALLPYLQGWRAFSAEHEVRWVHIERQVYHPVMGYAGTLDRLGLVDGLMTVLDIKSSVQLYPSVGPQLAAYQAAADVQTVQRMGVQLKPDGSYVAKVYSDPTDWPLFCSLLTVRSWCARHGITPDFKD